MCLFASIWPSSESCCSEMLLGEVPSPPSFKSPDQWVLDPTGQSLGQERASNDLGPHPQLSGWLFSSLEPLLVHLSSGCSETCAHMLLSWKVSATLLVSLDFPKPCFRPPLTASLLICPLSLLLLFPTHTFLSWFCFSPEPQAQSEKEMSELKGEKSLFSLSESFVHSFHKNQSSRSRIVSPWLRTRGSSGRHTERLCQWFVNFFRAACVFRAPRCQWGCPGLQDPPACPWVTHSYRPCMGLGEVRHVRCCV